MNINESLFKGIAGRCSGYHLDCSDLERFLTKSGIFHNRPRQAISLMKAAMAQHGKKALLDHVHELARVERGIRLPQLKLRDHVVHALLTFVLGIYINERLLGPRSDAYVDHFQWKIAGLLHDVGYPVEVSSNIARPFADKINELKRRWGVSRPDIQIQVIPVGLENLSGDVNGLDLIQKRLVDWRLDIDASQEYHRMVCSGTTCHGMISGLAVLHVIDMMYQRYNPSREHRNVHASGTPGSWNQGFFEEDVVSACSAVFIHNLGKQCFAARKIVRSQAPVAFLLKLSDCLQEWERPSLRNRKGYPATAFDIQIDDGRLIVDADIAETRKDEIREEICSSLDAPDVVIR